MSSIIRNVSVTATALLLSITVSTGCANSANNVSNAESDSMDKPVINASSASLISENMSDASDEFAQLKRFANAEEAAENFIKKYYEALYLCSPSDLSAYTAYSAFADYLNEKISYKQEISDYYSNIEGIDVEFELKEKVEYDDKCYFVYFVEVCYEEKGMSDFQSASGSTIQIIIDQKQYHVCDFYIANDSIDRKLRGFEKIDANKILWEDSQASETILLGLNEMAIFTGALGETLHTDDATSVDENTYRFDGWTYLGLSDGVVWNTIDNGNRIDESDFPKQTVTLFKAEEGYTVGGLTLEKASVEFNSGYSGIGVGAINAEFTGQLILEGYFYTFPADEGYEEKGDIFFLVNNGEWSGLPYANTRFCYWHWWTEKDFHWIANAPLLRLGNIEDYDFDLSFIKADGDVVRAKVVLDGLAVTEGSGVSIIYKSTIIDAEPV